VKHVIVYFRNPWKSTEARFAVGVVAVTMFALWLLEQPRITKITLKQFLDDFVQHGKVCRQVIQR